MPISAYVIRCTAEDQPRVRAGLATLPGVQVGDPTPTGFPVAAESSDNRSAADLGERLQDLPGVKAAVLVYHNFEDVAEEPVTVALPSTIRTRPHHANQSP